MVDPYLAAMARAAEAGTPCPAVWMTLDSGDIVTGTPHPSREFVDETFQMLADEIFREMRVKGLKADRQSASVDAANHRIKPFNVEIDTSEPHAMTLKDATVLWNGADGDGSRIPVLRIHLDSVALWWVTGLKSFKGGRSSFFGAVGVGIPLG